MLQYDDWRRKDRSQINIDRVRVATKTRDISMTVMMMFSMNRSCGQSSLDLQSYLFLIFGGHNSLLWGQWCPCFVLLGTFSLGFKAGVDPSFACFVTCVQWILQIHLTCDTCWPLGSQHGSRVINILWFAKVLLPTIKASCTLTTLCGSMWMEKWYYFTLIIVKCSKRMSHSSDQLQVEIWINIKRHETESLSNTKNHSKVSVYIKYHHGHQVYPIYMVYLTILTSRDINYLCRF